MSGSHGTTYRYGQVVHHPDVGGCFRDRVCNVGAGTAALRKGRFEGLKNDYEDLVSGADHLDRKVLCPASRSVSFLDLRGRAVSAGTWFPSRWLTASGNGSLLWSYGYDASGRLVSAAGSGHSYAYDFTTAVPGCPTGANANAGKNTNRGRLVDNGTAVVSYCYDMADREIAASGIAYDAHQNQVLHDGDTYRYDQADRHLATLVAGVRQVTLTRDALDRVVARTDTDLATNTASTTRYGYAGAGDLVSAVYDTANNLVETTIALPGGVLYTKRAGTGTDVWSYPNLHGDIAATRVNGTVTVFNWDPYGNPVNSLPDNSAGSSDWGWLGQHQRTLDHPTGLNPVIEMGARVYQPDTGRFQQTDPIEDGTTTNPYSYVPDPINQYDLNGQWCMLGTIKTVGPDGKTHKKCRGRGVVKNVVEVVKAAKPFVVGAYKFVKGCLKGALMGSWAGVGVMMYAPALAAVSESLLPAAAVVGCVTWGGWSVVSPSGIDSIPAPDLPPLP